MRNNSNDGHHLELPVQIQPNIGLDTEVRNAVVELLNIILADEVILSAKTRCAHWNVRGADFFGLRVLFEMQTQELNTITNKVAERARMLGGFAIGSLFDFLRLTRLEEQPGDVPDVLHLLADYETSIRFLRDDARKCLEEYEDAGTYDLLVELLRLHEKMSWMLRSYLEADLMVGKKQGSP